MKYIANPVEVDAFKILEVGPVETSNGKRLLKCSEDRHFFATPEMMSRMLPIVGDYLVIQSDNYPYLNPKDVFEHKYRPAEK